METRWRIDLFGRLQATQRDRVVNRFRARRAGSLLAYLAYHRDRPHPREVLIELLWPEVAPQIGRTNLRRELCALRRQLEPPGIVPGAVIVADRLCLRLNPAACTTDVADFEALLQTAARARNRLEQAQRLAEAVELYRGELLPGYFEDWILPERQRLAEGFFGALRQLAAYHEEAGGLTEAVRWARRAAAADPLREEAHHLLIRLLAAGRPEEARRQYRELERLLAQEAGSEPAPEIAEFIGGLERKGRPAGAERDTRQVDAWPEPSAPHSSQRIAAPASIPSGTVTFLVAEIDEGKG
jgi:DNA-binding SARP family transcriptional activator